MLADLWHDIRYGMRMLRKSPGFTLVAVLTLALGIGATSTVFSVVHAVLLRPLPFEAPERLVMVWESNPQRGLPYMFASPPNFADWHADNPAFAAMAAYRFRDFNLLADGQPERIKGITASGELFTVLGVSPARGRTFGPQDDAPGAEPVVVLSHGLWQRRFGGRPEVLGRSVELQGRSYEVIGVMPAGFRFPPPMALQGLAAEERAELWTPLRLNYAAGQRGAHNLFVVARLAEGVSLERADSAMATVARRLEQAYPGTNSNWGARVVPLEEMVTGSVRTALVVLLGAVGFVLLIACANVANLLLARATARTREIAVRTALGAGRGRLVRQMLAESMLLAALGGAAGLALAGAGQDAVLALAPEGIPRLEEAGMSGAVLGFTVLIAALTAVLFGLAPALRASQIAPVEALKESARGGTGGRGRHRLRNALVVAEVALALMLLAGGGLLFRSFLGLQALPLGFDPANVVTMTVNLPPAAYPDASRRLGFFDELLERIAATPGVEAAGFVDGLPLGADRQGTSLEVEGQAAPPPGQEHVTNFSLVSPGYFRAMGVELVRGRLFDERDTGESPPVVVINTTLAERFLPGEDPLGRRIRLGFRSRVAHEIVGVVADERHESLTAELNPGVYLPYAQLPAAFPLTLVVRGSSQPGPLVAAVRGHVRGLDPALAVYDVRRMEEVLAGAVARPRFATFLLALFASLALALAAVGIYGVMAASVTGRTQEIGIRMALGAERSHIFRLVVGQGMALVAAGVVLGLAGALAVARFVESLLFGVEATDPLTFTAVAAVLAAVALVACWLPARRATRVDPIVALRYE